MLIALIISVAYLTVFLYARPCPSKTFSKCRAFLFYLRPNALLTFTPSIISSLADRRGSHNLLQACGMLTPIMGMAWGLSGAAEQISDVDQDDVAYDSVSLMIVHGLLISPPLILGLFAMVSTIYTYREAKSYESQRRVNAIKDPQKEQNRKSKKQPQQAQDGSGSGSWSFWSSLSSKSDEEAATKETSTAEAAPPPAESAAPPPAEDGGPSNEPDDDVDDESEAVTPHDDAIDVAETEANDAEEETVNIVAQRRVSISIPGITSTPSDRRKKRKKRKKKKKHKRKTTVVHPEAGPKRESSRSSRRVSRAPGSMKRLHSMMQAHRARNLAEGSSDGGSSSHHVRKKRGSARRETGRLHTETNVSAGPLQRIRSGTIRKISEVSSADLG